MNVKILSKICGVITEESYLNIFILKNLKNNLSQYIEIEGWNI